MGNTFSESPQAAFSRSTICAGAVEGSCAASNNDHPWRVHPPERLTGGMKGRKGSVDEGGLRVPILIRWPRRIRPGLRIPQIAGAIDLLPTLADMAEIRVASVKPLDGKSVKPLLPGWF